METASETARDAPDEVQTFIRYSERSADGGYIEKNGSYSFEMEDHDVTVRNARKLDTAFDTHGFALVKHPVDVDFTDQHDFEKRYYPEVCRLVKSMTGAREVFAFMGILRGGEDAKGGGPALSAHVDFDEAALRQWVARLAPDRAQELAGKRLVNINVWRGTIPVENYPLAVCDARSVSKEDFLRVSLGRPEGGFREGMPAGLNMAYNPKHQWYYFPFMQPDEALVFRLFDTGNPAWEMTGHTAFEDPTSDPYSAKRQSFEVRTIAVFDE
ncbi:hypothetical protein FHS61_001876 [Altererythrobacter atlanticus]|uniref:Uncharacterized protein n=1 Tax=Croceibacterium atlanticum TaxID=1267766 RepID=A0A0F7KLH1_9SPHN|nr:CmcJ/NvfI family oxidoreductase [Croceibacterium atlanticum]AKH41388.1 hypothetical protein WYH_00325 [Croceibacterium atlanticum]MBB5732850.1 hypothetical protein [Croceibacterium atlanticum]